MMGVDGIGIVHRRGDLEVSYHGFENEELFNMAQSAVQKTAFMLPFWLRDLRVELFRTLDNGAVAAVDLQVEYRKVCLDLSLQWFEVSEERRVFDMLHEFIHVAMAPWLAQTEEARDLIKDQNPQLHSVVTERCRQSVESVTQDLAHAIAPLINHGD